MKVLCREKKELKGNKEGINFAKLFVTDEIVTGETLALRKTEH